MSEWLSGQDIAFSFRLGVHASSVAWQFQTLPVWDRIIQVIVRCTIYAFSSIVQLWWSRRPHVLWSNLLVSRCWWNDLRPWNLNGSWLMGWDLERWLHHWIGRVRIVGGIVVRLDIVSHCIWWWVGCLDLRQIWEIAGVRLIGDMWAASSLSVRTAIARTLAAKFSLCYLYRHWECFELVWLIGDLLLGCLRYPVLIDLGLFFHLWSQMMFRRLALKQCVPPRWPENEEHLFGLVIWYVQNLGGLYEGDLVRV